MSTDPAPVAAGPRWVLPVLALLFIGPLLVAVYCYYFGSDWRPASSLNYGRLIDPPVTLVAAALPMVSGEMTREDFLMGHWSLIYISDNGCEANCLDALDKTRRVRLALREKAARVQRVLLYRNDPPGAGLLTGDPTDLLAVSLAGGDGALLLGQFASFAAAAPHATGLVYLVDPLGNAMMLYEPGFEMKGMLGDLKRLLKLSRIG